MVGKGVIKKLRARYPQANVVAVDYDPGSSEANQLNRLKLMLAVAMKKTEREAAAGDAPDAAEAAEPSVEIEM